MPMPSGIGVIDRMLAVPTEQPSDWYDYMKLMLKWPNLYYSTSA
jgi:hypothetical protein